MNPLQTKRHHPEISLTRIIKLCLIRGLKVGADRWFELGLLLVVGVVAVGQLITTIENNKGTTQQTDQLIAAAKISAYAADQNLQAARNFADSARHINEGIVKAVGKLQDQSEATSLLASEALVQAQASKASAEVSRLAFEAESRPYVSVTRIESGFDAKRQVFAFAPVIANAGRTTAQNVSYKMANSISIVDVSAKSNNGTRINLAPGATNTYLEKFDNRKDYAALIAGGITRFTVRIGLQYEWRNNQESSCTDWEYDPTVNLFINQGTVVNDPRNLCPK